MKFILSCDCQLQIQIVVDLNWFCFTWHYTRLKKNLGQLDGNALCPLHLLLLAFVIALVTGLKTVLCWGCVQLDVNLHTVIY